MEYKNILVNMLVNLGDVILTTSALDLIKKFFPYTKITALVKPVVKDAVIDNPVIDDVIIFDYKSKVSTFKQTREMISEIRRRKFDLSISFDRKLRPALLTFMSGIKKRVGPSKVFDDDTSRVTILYTDVIKITHDLNKTHQSETYQEIVRKFFNIEGHGTPQFPRTFSIKANELLSHFAPNKFKIALCVKGTFPLKNWSKEYFVEVVDALSIKYDAEFFIIGAPDDREYADEVIAAMKVDVKNFCGETSLTDLAEIFRKIDLFITVDTGSAHIAATTEVKMVTIFGCTPLSRWRPINPNAISLTSNEKCCPCKVKPENCPSYPKPNCLYNVKPEDVIKAAIELLDE
ncbi:MAG: glycosyltransferase family 9 protein [Selenomonadaceae bacterium]|nr:glycosyltransferase family 9 protein [Selenomonadaceae bacterium]